MRKQKESGGSKDAVDIIRIAIYIRLSKADNGKVQEESNSISMQRILIRKYITSKFTSCQITEYQDDGFPGTDFNRPGVQKLLEDARNGKFDCVVVKDFSRFGRDYIEVGSYLEQIFPFLGIRFISINDHYDSASYQGSTTDLDVNFRNLLYDLYSKDLSQKVKTSLRARKEGGQYISANAPFGYEKAPDDRHMLVICEDEAAVVRKIFSLALQGVTSSQTARKLNLENVPAPIEFKIRKGKTSRKPKGDKFYWNNSVICSILRNPVYAGDLEYGKTEKEQVGGRGILKARTEWKVIRNHHVPVISREDFEAVQKNRGKSHRKGKKSRHPLIGKAVCGCCRHNLQVREGLNPYFTCYNRYMAGLEGCVIKVNAMFLEQVVLFRLEQHKESRPFLEEQNPATEETGRYQQGFKEKRDGLLRDLRQAEREYGRLKQEHYKNYELYSLGKRAEFHSLRTDMEKQREAIQKLQEQVFKADEQVHKAETGKFIIDEDAGLASGIIEQYIDEIVIYDEKNIEIKWKV
ncbi:MAG: recombinase family protein [Lachnospiraceae bacterium]|nr:recombinase family protein [Lachnospiraceae bacterium]